MTGRSSCMALDAENACVPTVGIARQGEDTPNCRQVPPPIGDSRTEGKPLACRASALTTELIARVSDCVADIRLGEPIGEYHRDETLSTSKIKDFLVGGPEYFHACHVERSVQRSKTAAFNHGDLLHYWLETLDDSFSFAVASPKSELTPSEGIGQKARKWFEAQGFPEETFLVSPSELAQAKAEARAVRRAAGNLIDEIVGHEVSIRFDISGCPVKCRADAITATRFLDLKTTRERWLLKDFWKSVADYGYDVQDYIYQRGMEACGMEAAPLIFIVVSTTSGQCRCVTLPQQMTRAAGRRVEAALQDIALRRELDCWLPDEHGDVVELPVPAGVLGRYENE